MVAIIGSMAVKGVFKAGGLLTGLTKTATKFKAAQHESKGASTEMKRMKGSAHALEKALALIGVGGFTALVMSAPQLTGALTKIKTEMQLIAWSVGKHLKPALDDVAGILHGIRTGDWESVKQGVVDLSNSLLELVTKPVRFIVDAVFGEGTLDSALTDFETWVENLKTAWDKGDLGALISTAIVDPIKWVLDKAYKAGEQFGEHIQTSEGSEQMKNMLLNMIPGGRAIAGLVEHAPRFAGYDRAVAQKEEKMGKYVETSNINVDFSGANINLASGVEVEQFADVVSTRIAEKQQAVTY